MEIPAAGRKFSRWLVPLIFLAVLLGGGTLLAVCLAASGRIQSPAGAPGRVEWRELPHPRIVHPGWRSFAPGLHVRGVQPAAGWLWVATDGGLFVLDRTSGEVLRLAVEHGLPGNRLSNVVQAPDGRIWVGSQGSGVGVFDGTSWQNFSIGEGLPDGRVTGLVAGRDGAVWAGTPAGLARYNGRRWRAERFNLLSFRSPAVRGLAGAPDGVWVATDEGVWHNDGRDWRQFTIRDGLISDDATAITTAADGTVWVGTARGLNRYRAGRWDRFTVRDGLRDAPIAHLATGAPGEVWVAYGGQFSHELARFDGVTPRHNTPGIGQPSGEIHSLVVEGDTLWVGTESGLWRFQNQSWQVQLLPAELPGTPVELAAVEDAVWAGGPGGLSRWGSGTWRTLTEEPIGALAAGPDGKIIAAGPTPADGFLIFEPGGFEPRRCSTAGPPTTFALDGAVGPDGAVWLLGDAAIHRYEDGSWQAFGKGWPAAATPRTLSISPTGEIWAGLAEGLFRLDQVQSRWQLVAAADVYNLAVGPDGILWLVTAEGVAHLDEGRLQTVGRPSQFRPTYGFVVNEQGVWLSGREGIAHLDKQGWRRFDTADGLASSEVLTLALDERGRVWAAYGDSRLGFSVLTHEGWQIVHNVAASGGPHGGHAGSLNPRRDEVLALAVSGEDEAWFGTENGQVGRVSPNSLLYRPDDLQLVWDSVRAILVDGEKEVWIVDRDGRIGRFDPQQGVWDRFDKALQEATVTAAVAGRIGIWLGTDRGVVRFQGEVCDFVAHRDPLAVTAGLADPAGNGVWWTTANAGALRLKNAAGGLNWPVLGLRGRPLVDLAQGRDDVLWFAEAANLWRLPDPAGRPLPFPLPEDLPAITAVAIAPDLRPWLGTTGGIFIPEGEKWRRLLPADGLADEIILDLLIEEDGTVWAATPGGLSRYDP